jgi:hypothetical protein
VDRNGNSFITGQSFDTIPGSIAAYITTLKYSPAGVPLWTNHFSGGNVGNQASAIALDAGGNVFVAGDYFATPTTKDVVTLKYGNNGTPIWTNRYGALQNSNDVARAIAVDNKGNVFVAGTSAGANTGDDIVTIKYSNAGVPLWTNRYDGLPHADDQVTSRICLALSPDGGVLVVGSSDGDFSGNTTPDFVTIKYVSLPAIVAGPTVEAGQFILRIIGEPGSGYTIERTDALSPANWQKATNLIAPTNDTGLGIGVFEFREALNGAARKFYRAVNPAY